MWDAIVSGILGDKNQGWQDIYRCPYMLCPSNKHLMSPDVEDGYIKPARMKFVQKVQPRVYQYRCKDCGCLANKSVEITADGREVWRINPVLVSDKPSFQTMGVMARWK